MSKMKMFRVSAWEECTWEKDIMAENEKDAEAKAYKMITNGKGFSDWDVGNHGQTEITSVEEI